MTLQRTALLTLAVLDTCAAPGAFTELACSTVYDVDQLDIAVTAGETVTILVEGFNADSLGTYTLTATLL